VTACSLRQTALGVVPGVVPEWLWTTLDCDLGSEESRGGPLSGTGRVQFTSSQLYTSCASSSFKVKVKGKPPTLTRSEKLTTSKSVIKRTALEGPHGVARRWGERDRKGSSLPLGWWPGSSALARGSQEHRLQVPLPRSSQRECSGQAIQTEEGIRTSRFVCRGRRTVEQRENTS
jgi:hypothetical protein